MEKLSTATVGIEIKTLLSEKNKRRCNQTHLILYPVHIFSI